MPVGRSGPCRGDFLKLEPNSLDDLEGELREVSFRPEGAAIIGSKVPA